MVKWRGNSGRKTFEWNGGLDGATHRDISWASLCRFLDLCAGGRNNLTFDMDLCLSHIDEDLTLQYNYEKVPLLLANMKMVWDGIF